MDRGSIYSLGAGRRGGDVAEEDSDRIGVVRQGNQTFVLGSWRVFRDAESDLDYFVAFVFLSLVSQSVPRIFCDDSAVRLPRARL